MVDAYRKNFGIAADFPLTEEMCRYHWDLERALTRQLLESTPEDRWETFERCYTTLYRELPWLYSGQPPQLTPRELEAKHGYWRYWIGAPPRKVYEVGSGRGELIACLAHLGYECRATEITRERGQRWVDDLPNLTWGTTDGVHLARFEPANTYDAVISDQVIEHLHPDDLLEHFRGALRILKPGGRYVFRTPHVHDGPSDVSRFFGCDTPQGMHLREYTYRELAATMTRAGFRHVRAWTPPPPPLPPGQGAAGRTRPRRDLSALSFPAGIGHRPAPHPIRPPPRRPLRAQAIPLRAEHRHARR